jgi:hypothetical protein
LVSPRTNRAATYGAWIGCLLVKGLPERGAEYDTLHARFFFWEDFAQLEFEDEPRCRGARLEPWPDMTNGSG